VERVTARELGGQLREVVSLLCASAGQQAEFIRESAPFALPPDDLLMQLDLAVPGWLPRLLDAGVIDDSVADQLVALLGFVLDAPKTVWRDDPGVFDDPAWDAIRRRAATALGALDASFQRFDGR
jgi:hypothetical protein